MLVDGSPRASLPAVHYSAFVNEGFDNNNCCLDRHRRGAWYLSTLDIFHFHKVLSAYGEEYWRLGTHSPALKAFAADYYARYPANFQASQPFYLVLMLVIYMSCWMVKQRFFRYL